MMNNLDKILASIMLAVCAVILAFLLYIYA